MSLMRVTNKRLVWDLINRKAIFGMVRDRALGPSAIDSNGGLNLVPTHRLAGSGTLAFVGSGACARTNESILLTIQYLQRLSLNR